MKSTHLGVATVIQDDKQQFGLDGLYYHVRVKFRDVGGREVYQRHLVFSPHELAMMEGRAERNMESLPDEHRESMHITLIIYLAWLTVGLMLGALVGRWL